MKKAIQTCIEMERPQYIKDAIAELMAIHEQTISLAELAASVADTTTTLNGVTK